MSKKKPPRKRKLPREFRRPPNTEQSMAIAENIYGFAVLVADGEPEKAVDAIRDWVGRGPVARLRTDYIASLAPVITVGLMRKHFPVDMDPDDFWIMEHLPNADTNIHTDALCQVLVRHLNDDHETARDLLQAHIDTHGDEGLFWFGVAAIKALAGVILAAREKDSEVSS